MKILNFIALFFCFYGFAQDEKLGRTVMTECSGNERPRDCTFRKLNDGIVSLLTPELTAPLRLKGVTSIVITSALIIDEKGKVIPDQLEVHCEHEDIKKIVKNYYLTLTDFAVAENMHLATEKRALYLAQYVFVYNSIKNKFIQMLDYKTRGFKTFDLPELIGTPYYSKNCKDSSNRIECTREELSKFFMSNFNVPKDLANGVYKYKIKFIISPKGKFHKIEISDKRFEEESLRVMQLQPDLSPASVHGIGYGVAYSLPITLTIKK